MMRAVWNDAILDGIGFECSNAHPMALAAMFIPGMMPHRLKMKIVKNRVVIIGT